VFDNKLWLFGGFDANFDIRIRLGARMMASRGAHRYEENSNPTEASGLSLL
jgi:hypothetical protein